MADEKKVHVRATLRFDSDTHQRAIYWADRKGISLSAYAEEAIREKIDRDNGVHVIPNSLLDNRLNQIVDQLSSFARELANNTTVVTSGFDTIIGMTRGDSYLSDDLDGLG